MAESPYGEALPRGVSYGRVTALTGEAVAGALLAIVRQVEAPVADLVLQLTDWSSFGATPMPEPLKSLREAFPDESSQFARLGISFEAPELLALGSCCAHITDEGLSAYVYSVNPSFCVYLWEGEFLEVWSSQAEVVNTVVQHLVAGGAKVIAQNGG